ncbi:hypothetical protein LINGRAHAP2_LOCUS2887 [Linum grandiflorum]
MAASEKRGGPQPTRSRISTFLTFIDHLQLLDIGFRGSPFTWSNRHADSATLVDERLDRYLFNDAWLQQWPESAVTHLLPLSSDHAPILLSLAVPPTRCGRLFRFDCRWADNPEVLALVQHYWGTLRVVGSPQFRVMTKLKRLRHVLYDWSSAGTSNSARLLRDLDGALRTALTSPTTDWVEVHRLEGERAGAHHQEETYWRQRRHNNWLQRGDRNTAYFHRSVSASRKRKRIDVLESADGLLLDEEAKGAHAVSFYTALFSTEHTVPAVDLTSLQLQPIVTDRMNSALLARVSSSDVRQAVFSIGPMQAPGPDGFTGLFFQRC